MNRPNRWMAAFLLFINLAGCSQPSRLEQALTLSGENRSELEQVLEHYREDPEKLKAARFLIENMTDHYHLTIDKEFCRQVDSLNKSDISHNELYRYLKNIGQNRSFRTQAIRDIRSLNAGFLIRHIDHAVDHWRNSPWYDPSGFDHFCEYTLPYAVTTEERENWQEYYRAAYQPFLTSYLDEVKADSLSLPHFCDYLNNALIKRGRITLDLNFSNTYPPLMLDNIKAGSCDNYSARAVYIMRSLGMPVCCDFTPQWTAYFTGHSWNVLVNRDHRGIPFMGFDQNSSEWQIPPSFRCAKVFRRMYSVQPQSLAARQLTSRIPGFLTSPYLKDVTDQYLPAHDVEIELENPNREKVGYLSVFARDWMVIHWGELKGRKAVFEKMGPHVVYLPSLLNESGWMGAGNPFYIDSLGTVREIVPHPIQKQTLRVERKYTVTMRINLFLERMLRGCFQGSNDPGFKQADTLHFIRELPKMTYNTVEIQTEKKYRYVRYKGPKDSYNNVAEIEFYSTPTPRGREERLQGKVIGIVNDPAVDPRGYDPPNVFDGDPLTFYNTTFDIPAYVGLDLGTPQTIQTIRYLPRNDDNNIRYGDTYELMYWDQNRWNSLGTQVGEIDELVFENCPVGALFVLRNHTRGQEERIFTYENGKQIWW